MRGGHPSFNKLLHRQDVIGYTIPIFPTASRTDSHLSIMFIVQNFVGRISLTLTTLAK